jgi:hypothetical protein
MELSPGGSPLSRGVWSLAKVYIILLSDTTTIHLFRGKRDAPKGVILFSGSIGKMGWGKGPVFTGYSHLIKSYTPI